MVTSKLSSGDEGYDGVFIALEGIDGSGKSSAMESIEKWADDVDADVTLTAEPTKRSKASIEAAQTPIETLFAFAHDRRRHVEKTILPALRAGEIVVTDRYLGSTRAYQTDAIAESCNIKPSRASNWIALLHSGWAPRSDLTIYVDTEVENAIMRIDTHDRFETLERLHIAKERYDMMYGPCAASVRRIDGNGSIESTRHGVLSAVKARWRQKQTATGSKTYAEAVEEQ